MLMQPLHEGIIFNHMADDTQKVSQRPSVSDIVLFVAEETVMVMLMLSMIFLM
jgi:hypothetical protein